MKVVSNTSPLIAFAKISQFEILKSLFTRVIIPDTVANEFLKNSTENEKKSFEIACKEYIEIAEVKGEYLFTRNLDQGEKDALSLSIQEKAMIIIDDKKGYNEAKQLGLIAVSTRAVLKIAYEKNLIKSLDEIENKLNYKKFFLSEY